LVVEDLLRPLGLFPASCGIHEQHDRPGEDRAYPVHHQEAPSVVRILGPFPDQEEAPGDRENFSNNPGFGWSSCGAGRDLLSLHGVPGAVVQVDHVEL
jgi:hypothetical protein